MRHEAGIYRRRCHPDVGPLTLPLPRDQSLFSPRCNSSGTNVARRNKSNTYGRESAESTAKGSKRRRGDPAPSKEVNEDLLLDCLDSGGVRVATLALLDGIVQMHDQIFVDSIYTFAWYTRSRNLSNSDTARSFEVELAPHPAYTRRETSTTGGVRVVVQRSYHVPRRVDPLAASLP